MIVNRIEDAELDAATYRTARRLLDRADAATGALRLTHEELRTLAGTDADATARRHLIKLQGLGIIAYRRNSVVDVWFADWLSDNVINGDHECAPVRDGDHHMINVITTRSPSRTGDQPEVRDGDHQARRLITTRAPVRSLPHTHASAYGFSSLVSSLPTPNERELTNEPEPPEPQNDPEPPPLAIPEEEQQRSLALLTDPDVGLDRRTAVQFAAQYEFSYLLTHVCVWRRELDGGKVRGNGALRTRIRKGFGGALSKTDRASPLFVRHATADEREPDGDSEEARRHKYIPDEYRDIILG
jgi:hypothetical protein